MANNMTLTKRDSPLNIGKKFDTFDYVIKRVKYENSYTSGENSLRCVFIINGKDIYEIIKEALNGIGAYHHTTPLDLWAFDLCDDPYQPGRIHPLICSCDELGCSNIAIRVTENTESVVWYDFYQGNAMDDDDEAENIENLKLSFEFEKNNYNQKMEEIKKISQALCSK